MYSKEITVDDEELTVEQGDVFDVHARFNLGDDKTLEDGDVLTVANISKYPDGVHFEFSVDGKPGHIETIMQYAVENLLEGEQLTRRD